jgi:hypothetical protein
MDLTRIAERYRGEMVEVFAKLADMVRENRLTSRQFLAAQRRVFQAYVAASR